MAGGAGYGRSPGLFCASSSSRRRQCSLSAGRPVPLASPLSYVNWRGVRVRPVDA
jgi:hypothetical protein